MAFDIKDETRPEALEQCAFREPGQRQFPEMPRFLGSAEQHHHQKQQLAHFGGAA